MDEKKLHEIRDAEDEALIRHILDMKKIINIKCARCKAYSCMGCVFDEIDPSCLKGLIVQALDRMKTQNLTVFNKCM